MRHQRHVCRCQRRRERSQGDRHRSICRRHRRTRSFAAIGSRYQKKWGTNINKFDFVTLATQAAGGHVDQRLHLTFAERSGEVMTGTATALPNEASNFGMKPSTMSKTRVIPPSRRATRRDGRRPVGKTIRRAKSASMATLFSTIMPSSTVPEFHYNTKMVKLEKANGRITGCIAENSDGRYVRYLASKGVVIATGGYCRNYDMLEALQPWNLRILGGNKSMPGAIGDGIRACLWVGAKMDETHSMAQFDPQRASSRSGTGIEAMKKTDMGTFWPGSQPCSR